MGPHITIETKNKTDPLERETDKKYIYIYLYIIYIYFFLCRGGFWARVFGVMGFFDYMGPRKRDIF